MARAARWYRALVAGVHRRVEQEWRRKEKQEEWCEENERVRGRRRTPKAERPRCGARCRDGHPCQARAVWDRERGEVRNGRCRMHGGLSTGPQTEEGKRRSLEGARKGGRVSAERRKERPPL